MKFSMSGQIKMWPFNTGDCLTELTAWTGLTILYNKNNFSIHHSSTNLSCPHLISSSFRGRHLTTTIIFSELLYLSLDCKKVKVHIYQNQTKYDSHIGCNVRYVPVFPKVNWSWMDIWSSKGVQITGPSIKFTGHSHAPQRRCSDSYWSFGPVMNNLLLDQTNFYWTLPHVRRTLGITDVQK